MLHYIIHTDPSDMDWDTALFHEVRQVKNAKKVIMINRPIYVTNSVNECIKPWGSWPWFFALFYRKHLEIFYWSFGSFHSQYWIFNITKKKLKIPNNKHNKSIENNYWTVLYWNTNRWMKWSSCFINLSGKNSTTVNNNLTSQEIYLRRQRENIIIKRENCYLPDRCCVKPWPFLFSLFPLRQQLKTERWIIYYFTFTEEKQTNSLKMISIFHTKGLGLRNHRYS